MVFHPLVLCVLDIPGEIDTGPVDQCVVHRREEFHCGGVHGKAPGSDIQRPEILSVERDHKPVVFRAVFEGGERIAVIPDVGFVQGSGRIIAEIQIIGYLGEFAIDIRGVPPQGDLRFSQYGKIGRRDHFHGWWIIDVDHGKIECIG